MPEFFERLNYSFGNEDWTTEQQALKVKADDTVLCITASGDRPFHLLLDECKELISIDANPIQNYLLQLKQAAMSNLNFEEYLSFLGALPDSGLSRKSSFKKIASNISDEECLRYWHQNQKMIEKGVLYQGEIEKITKWASRGFHVYRPNKLKTLFQFNDLEEQRKFLKEKWDTLFLRKLFQIVINPTLSKLFLRDPGLYGYVDPSISVGGYIYNRMLNCLDKCLAKKNILISLVFLGYVKEEGLPPYLTEEGAKLIKKRLNKLSVKTANVIDFMEKEKADSIDCFSLSDIASYMSQEEFIRMLKAVKHTAKPGARFCIRQFTSNHHVPDEFTEVFQRDKELEGELEAKDQCFLYRFMVGTIKK